MAVFFVAQLYPTKPESMSLMHTENTDMTSAHVSLILDPRAMFLQVQLNLVSAAVVCAVLELISDLDLLSVTTEPRHLKLGRWM